MTPLPLLTPLSTLERLHVLADGKGKVSIERDTLAKLLIDHAALCKACKAAGRALVEPAPPRPHLR